VSPLICSGVVLSALSQKHLPSLFRMNPFASKFVQLPDDNGVFLSLHASKQFWSFASSVLPVLSLLPSYILISLPSLHSPSWAKANESTAGGI